MKTNSFERAMQQITNEFETQRVEEDRKVQRRVLVGRIRKVISVLVLLGICGTIYAKRTDIQNLITAKFTHATAVSNASASLDKARENANARDAVIDSMMK
jgi:hypothetical protein